MPSFQSEMEYACLTKTHFVHAVKLASDGSRTLYNLKNGPKIAFKNSEHILQNGLNVQIFGEELWEDTEAMLALMTEDNKNADICMRENEIQIMGMVDNAVKQQRAEGLEITEGTLLTMLKKRGVNTWKDDHLKALIFFTIAIDCKIGDQFLLRMCSLHHHSHFDFYHTVHEQHKQHEHHNMHSSTDYIRTYLRTKVADLS